MMNSEPKQYLIKSVVVEAVQVEEDVEVEVIDSKKLLKAGDLIVTHKDGRKLVETNEQFNKKYFELES